jgi:hypothetical protein
MKDEKPQRVCFVLHIKAQPLEEYKHWHRNVWPELLRGFEETGWHNLSLFLREDGLLIGYVMWLSESRPVSILDCRNTGGDVAIRDFDLTAIALGSNGARGFHERS